MLISLISLLVFLISASLFGVARLADWQNLARIEIGQRVTIFYRQQKYLSGAFVRFSESGLTILVNGLENTIERDHVIRVTTEEGKRLRNALIGVAIGAVVGLGLAVFFLEHEGNYAGAVAVAIAGAATVAAGIGALIPDGKIVYRARAHKRIGGSTPRMTWRFTRSKSG